MSTDVSALAAGRAVVEVRNVSKTFGATQALKDVSLSMHAGSIHALIGMNGSGKSTLVKILSGFYVPNPGSVISVDGRELSFGDPVSSDALGLRFVHQDLALIPTLSVTENLALVCGYQASKAGPINWRTENARAREMLSTYGYSVDVTRRVGELTAFEKSAVAIVRALAPTRNETRAIILDEPTATMPVAEVGQLFELVRSVRDRGVAILYISHHLSEILDLSDCVTVLRDGEAVFSQPRQGLGESDLVEAVVGSQLAAAGPATGSAEASVKSEAAGSGDLEISELSGGTVRTFDLSAMRGEVVGIAGVAGSGREDVCRLVFGTIPRTAGQISVGGFRIGDEDLASAVAAGILLVPAERKREALFPTMSVLENLTIGDLKSVSRRGRIGLQTLHRSRESKDTAEWVKRLNIKTASLDTPVSLLSGGNQQKVIFARTLRRRPKVLLLDEPTQGVDVSAKQDIYELIRHAASDGAIVLAASSDPEDLVRIASRVLVFVGGRVVDELVGDDITEHQIQASSLREPVNANGGRQL